MKRMTAIAGVLSALAATHVAHTAPRASQRFAVVIGNNKSLLGNRPDLHYADDDAARYFDIFESIAPEHAYLLTSFDRDSARLFERSRRRAVRPTRAELERVGRDLSAAVQAATNAGRETELYFVFAGHGDVDAGQGFIELEDGRLASHELEAWLRSIPFTRAHVVLDSCNSFFMLGVRKPGGRYFATPADIGRSLAARLPNVGVFLSTSAEGETFEWSELQSGIFSHVVRSGLLGGADANGDGAVSYLELAAFVATATADVRNPNLRPHAYARGPAERDDAPIVELRGRRSARRLRLADGAPLRVRLRDAEGMPLFDAHAEAGSELDVELPLAWTNGAALDRLSTRPGNEQSYAVRDNGDALELALPDSPGMLAASRGPGDLFRKLFARPFGPRALAEFSSEARRTPQPVFGVSRADSARMNLLLDQIASAERSQRLVTGTYALGAGALFGGLAASEFAFRNSAGIDRKGADLASALYLGVGVFSLGMGAYTLARPWEGERIFADYRMALAHGGDPGLAFATADARLQELARSEQRRRWAGGIAGGILLLGGATLIVGGEFSNRSADERLTTRVLGGAAGLLGATAVAAAVLIESPIERLTRVWRDEPTRPTWTPTLMATPGGALFGAVGQF